MEERQRALPASNNLTAVELAQHLIHGPWIEYHEQNLQAREEAIRELLEMIAQTRQSALPPTPSS